MDRRWAVLAMLVGVRVSLGVQFQSVGSVGAMLVGPVVADFAALGILIGLSQLPGAAVALPGGWLTAWLGDRRALLGGLGLMVLGGAVLARAPGFEMALAGRLLAGVGASLVNLVLTKGVMDRFSGAELTVAMGWLLAAWPVGIALSLVLLPPLAMGAGWSAALLAATLPALAGLLAIWRTGYGRVVAARQARPGLWPERRAWAPLLVLSVGWAGFNAALVIVLGFAPAWLAERGYGMAGAGWVASLAGWGAVPLLPFGGRAAARAGSVLRFSAGVTALMAASVAFLPEAPLPLLLLYGLLGGLAGGPMASLPATILPPERRPLGLGVFYTLYGLGMAGLPALAGRARDLSGDAFAPLGFAALLLGVSVLCVLGFGLLRNRLLRPEGAVKG
ncbi:hypothetical protein RGI145_14025 [Roseomonas gilardii]|uniref:Major facilitator superfamily (MFS) profile domain-containing protein n=1 Tax=Roseomonas gilardii TaxID=257708 RepID=A0A1L7AH14_9PROT|nr:MFS transporter [Roseomonas gilardii]APT58065.1 hypothetical protein RGI145_14025 [Roseomonas gilardii]